LYHLNNKNTIYCGITVHKPYWMYTQTTVFTVAETSSIVSIDADVAASGKVARAVIVIPLENSLRQGS